MESSPSVRNYARIVSNPNIQLAKTPRISGAELRVLVPGIEVVSSGWWMKPAIEGKFVYRESSQHSHLRSDAIDFYRRLGGYRFYLGPCGLPKNLADFVVERDGVVSLVETLSSGTIINRPWTIEKKLKLLTLTDLVLNYPIEHQSLMLLMASPRPGLTHLPLPARPYDEPLYPLDEYLPY